MSNLNWKELLTQLNEKLLSPNEKDSRQTNLDILDSSWLGNIGATEAEIKDLETRIGTSLPPSYRGFLKFSNGWDKTDWEDFKLYSTKEVDWLCVKNWEWKKLNHYYIPEDIPSVADEYYFVYGEKQNSSDYREEYLETALTISSNSEDGDFYLLIPEVINKQEEWEAWYLSSKLPGAYRYQSFYELMKHVAEHGSFIL